MVNLYPGAACKICDGPVPPRTRRRDTGRLSARVICCDPSCTAKNRALALEAAHAKSYALSAALGHERVTECAICLGPMPKGCRVTRQTCDRPECVSELRRYSARVAMLARKRQLATKPPATRRRCCECRRTKPLNEETFARIAAGTLGYRCRVCERLRQKRMYRARKAQRRRFERIYRAKFAPSAPLAAALQREIDRRGGDTAAVFVQAGINDSPTKPSDSRRFREWRSGRAASVRPELADRVITGLDLLWIDVWNPETRASDDVFSTRRAVDVTRWIDAVWDAQYVFEGQ